jgi:hypothetical protein
MAKLALRAGADMVNVKMKTRNAACGMDFMMDGDPTQFCSSSSLLRLGR